MELQDRFQGAMVGLAVGDALGKPTEFISTLEAIHDLFGPEGVTDFVGNGHPPGTYTDDTQMSLCVARALLKAGRGSLDELMSVMAEEFVAWDRSPENDRAPGVTCRASCEKLAEGVPWRESGVAESKGCGSAMRTAPIGLYFLEDEERLIEVARASSLLTHGHPTALASAAATALLVAWAAKGEDPAEYPSRLVKVMVDMTDGREVAALVQRIPEMLTEPPENVLHHGDLGEGWTGEEAVASALYCLCRSPDEFRRTVLVAANTVGDSDSIGCIAGAISGAYNGIGAIPKSWREQVENSAYLHEIASELLAARCAVR
jgi:ADP-ribosylglycohydrolase